MLLTLDNDVLDHHAKLNWQCCKGSIAAESVAQSKQLWRRLEEVKKLQAELSAQVDKLKKSAGANAAEAVPVGDLRIPQDIRKTKMQQVQGLLARETALVEAVTSRLEKLQTSV